VIGVPNLDHIVLIMLENRDYKTVIGPDSQMPLLNTLAQQEVILSNYFAVAHPSLPNYIALVSGSTQGITSDCTACFVNQPNLADLIEASGRTWKSYEESMPSPCFIGDANPYAQKHDPFLYFDSIRLNAARCNQSIVPLTTLDGDLANNQLPNFSFIMPNLCNSGHDCSAATADKWVTDMVAKLQASPALGKNSLIIVAFDEGNEKSKAGCCGLGSPAGGQVAVMFISPTAIAGFNDTTAYSHFSLLKTILTAWNLPALGQTSRNSTQVIESPWTGQVGQTSTNNANGSNASGTGTSNNTPVPVQAGSCVTSSPASNDYTTRVCFSSPDTGGTLTGNVTVSAIARVSGQSRVGVQDLQFYLDGTYLLSAFSSPFTFLLPTANWLDGSHTLSVAAQMHDKFTTQQGTLPVVFNNGVTSLPVNTSQFQPATGTTPANGAPFIVAAGGDGASGEPAATKVTNLIASLNPNMFLYLGDVYENGSPSEFFNWYGTTSNFGQFRSITNPTVGNHEYLTPGAAGYFDYWNNIPSYYSFNAGGWHFISLNSNLAKIGNSGQSAQAQWLQQDLAANQNACTIVYYHHPLFNIGPEGPTAALSAIWSLLAQYGVTMVLNGHDHDYQRWVPLDGNGQPNPNGITEFVVGSAGHGIQKFVTTDNRVAFSNDSTSAAFGVLMLQLNQDSAAFAYQSTDGAILDSGVIPCVHAAPVSLVPGLTSGISATATGLADVAFLETDSSRLIPRRQRVLVG
jgi:Predicted phosphohydrolases